MTLTVKKPVRQTHVLVVDDHPVVRLGIRQMIAAEPDLSVCAEADTPDAALSACRSSHVDLAIVDLSLGSTSGLELIKVLHEEYPTLPILVLSMHDESLFAQRALRAGARGYLQKHEAIEGLVRAIREVVAGKVYVSDTVAQQVLAGLRGATSAPTDQLATLTDREIQVLERVGRGSSTAEIADDLGVSVKTIETYRSNIKAKLNLKSALDLVRYATSWIERP
ncbi:MAG TPA: response regulator transcription factor [Vicinamibacterales bacterium]|jgi:DNA-binding NarL/FixJ family response regulator